MRRRVCAAVLCVLLGFALLTPVQVSAQQADKTALVVWMQKDTGAAAQQTKEIIRQVLSAGYACDAVPQARYTAGSAQKYAFVLVAGQDGAAPSDTLLQDLLAYSGRLAWIGPGAGTLFARRSAGTLQAADAVSSVRYRQNGGWQTIGLDASAAVETYAVPQTADVRGTAGTGAFAFSAGPLFYFGLASGLESGPLLRAALQDFLTGFFGLAEQTPAVYFNLDDIYPVSDFSLLTKMGAYLKEKGVPFTFTVMPFYDNAKSSAAASYGNLLRYLESCGGTPVLHLPVFQPMSSGDIPAYTDMESHLAAALGVYAGLGVYPAALEMPEDMLFYTGFTQFLTQTDVLFTTAGDGKDDYVVAASTEDASLPETQTAFQGGAAVAHALRAGASAASAETAADAAAFLQGGRGGMWQIACPSTLSYTSFCALVDSLSSRSVDFGDLSLGSYTVRAGQNTVSRQNGSVTYNGQIVSALPVYPAASAASSARTASSGETAPWFFTLPAVGVMAVLLVALLVNWRKNRNKFLKRR